MDPLLILGLTIPFVGTSLGAAMVFFLRGELNDHLRKALLGFASGVMIAASFWSLLNPAIEMTIESGGIAWLPPAIGFLAVTLHNIPEGLAVGITFAGALNQDVAMTMTGALALAIGIAVGFVLMMVLDVALG